VYLVCHYGVLLCIAKGQSEGLRKKLRDVQKSERFIRRTWGERRREKATQPATFAARMVA
jgi:hypothetical protein